MGTLYMRRFCEILYIVGYERSLKSIKNKMCDIKDQYYVEALSQTQYNNLYMNLPRVVFLFSIIYVKYKSIFS